MTADTPREPVTPPTVGDGIRAMRQGLGITAAELARRASVSRSYVGDIESGRRNPTLAVALRIAAGLNRSLLDVAGLSVPDAVVDVGRSPLLIAALGEARAAGLREGPLDVERLAQALSTWTTIGEGDPEFMAWAEQIIRSYFNPPAQLEPELRP